MEKPLTRLTGLTTAAVTALCSAQRLGGPFASGPLASSSTYNSQNE
jgi:hypothetical protein